ncbi:hypothetical protein BV22DRAFT_389412 [Leucogyrophana mollusca]|uniref:Uncharacterized protein n=1 Tax=Leucogyrophana mollusca TaxID=85980 RepID=A0ACB8BME9_9AGAM|nr:hypothetical protein BV22DRAFT_389412 [Leucogyrophana mollusca]
MHALPEDLERTIFGLAARDHPECAPTLTLVARRVKAWIEPIIYATVDFCPGHYPRGLFDALCLKLNNAPGPDNLAQPINTIYFHTEERSRGCSRRGWLPYMMKSKSVKQMSPILFYAATGATNLGFCALYPGEFDALFFKMHGDHQPTRLSSCYPLMHRFLLKRGPTFSARLTHLGLEYSCPFKRTPGSDFDWTSRLTHLSIYCQDGEAQAALDFGRNFPALGLYVLIIPESTQDTVTSVLISGAGDFLPNIVLMPWHWPDIRWRTEFHYRRGEWAFWPFVESIATRQRDYFSRGEPCLLRHHLEDKLFRSACRRGNTCNCYPPYKWSVIQQDMRFHRPDRVLFHDPGSM